MVLYGFRYGLVVGMQRLVLFMFVAVTMIPFFAKGDPYGRFHLLPGTFGYIWELMGGFALINVIFVGARRRFRHIRPAYWLVFGTLVVTIVCGVLINSVGSGPVFAGIRTYFRAMPWFFLPAVFYFTEEQIRRQLKWLLGICLLQLPIAIEQRMHSFVVGWGGTGDSTQGTLGDSGTLSIFLVSAVCVVTAFYGRKELKLPKYVVLFLLILIPTMINETKVTIFLLPLGLIVSYLSASEPALRTRRFVSALGFLLFFSAIFVPVYDTLMKNRKDAVSLEQFFTDDKTMDKYMSENKEVGSKGTIRRGDALRVPLKYMAQDPIRLAFGYGIGNVSESSFGRNFSGAYVIWDAFAVVSVSKFLLELGMLGLVLVLTLYWLILQDCRVLARQGQGLYNNLAAGWIGVVVVIFVATFYSVIHLLPSLSFLFWYFSGLIAAERMRVAVSGYKSENQTASAVHIGSKV